MLLLTRCCHGCFGWSYCQSNHSTTVQVQLLSVVFCSSGWGWFYPGQVGSNVPSVVWWCDLVGDGGGSGMYWRWCYLYDGSHASCSCIEVTLTCAISPKPTQSRPLAHFHDLDQSPPLPFIPFLCFCRVCSSISRQSRRVRRFRAVIIPPRAPPSCRKKEATGCCTHEV